MQVGSGRLTSADDAANSDAATALLVGDPPARRSLGDATVVFGDVFAEMARRCDASCRKRAVTPETVVQWADRTNQHYLAAICRRVLLPGSGVEGLSQLQELAERAASGRSTLLCLNHPSNLDVPILYTLLDDLGRLDLFHRILWIAGRKLVEDSPLMQILAGTINRVVVSPPSFFTPERTEEERAEAKRINLAAHRAIRRLKREGWIFALFPSGTRMRPGRQATVQAIEETDSYLRVFDDLLPVHISGCTLPVSKDHGLIHEQPQRDRVVFRFGTTTTTEAWRAAARARHPQLDPKAATARSIMEDIAALSRPDGD